MTQELYINGRPADIGSADITLEYVSGFFGDFSKISFSRSYTVKLPRTQRNAQILGFTGDPAQEPELARRYFSAGYIRNGVDLLGEAQAYLLGVTPDSYEVALVWNSAPELLAWKNSKLKLRDIQGLTDPAWPGDVAEEGARLPVFYARYVSGLTYSTALTKTAPHPCITLYELLEKILNNAGVPHDIEQTLGQELQNTVLLVAPSHKPDLRQEIASGAAAESMTYGDGRWWFNGWTLGWDSPYETEPTTITSFQKGTADSVRILLNLKITSSSPGLYIELAHGNDAVQLYPRRTDDGGYLIDAVVELKDLGVAEDYDYIGIAIKGLVAGGAYSLSKYDDTLPIFAVMRVHDVLDTEHHGYFPVALNLPDIGQHDFLKAVLALFGVAPVVSGGVLHLEQYARFLGTGGAVDWTAKVDMTEGIERLAYTLDGRAQKNVIRYKEDGSLSFSPDIVMEVEDDTLPDSADLASLPFAASEGGAAVHYEVESEYTDEGYVYKVSDVDIKPRVFGFDHDADGERFLTFPERLYGAGNLAEHYAEYQEIIRRPVVITAHVRLSELDLAALDFKLPVYLGQYGRYYYILKVQTSATDLCKVELIQIP